MDAYNIFENRYIFSVVSKKTEYQCRMNVKYKIFVKRHFSSDAPRRRFARLVRDRRFFFHFWTDSDKFVKMSTLNYRLSTIAEKSI